MKDFKLDNLNNLNDEQLKALRKIFVDNYDLFTPEIKEKIRSKLREYGNKFSNDGKYKYFFNGDWVEMPIVCTLCAVHPPKLPLREMKESCHYIKYIFPLCEKNHCEGNMKDICFCSLGRYEKESEIIFKCEYKGFEVKISKKEEDELSEKSVDICGKYD